MTGSPDVPSQKVNLLMNFLILLPAFLLGVWYPKVGDLAAKLGAFACLFVVYCIPVVTYIKYKKTLIHNPELAKIVLEANVSPRVKERKDRNLIYSNDVVQRYTETT